MDRFLAIFIGDNSVLSKYSG